MAKAAGLSVSSVQRIGAPMVCNRTGCASSSFQRPALRRQIARRHRALYPIRPHTPSSCPVDERAGQALDRTQLGLPLKKGRAGTAAHDYERHGTTTLFAAMNILDGTVIGRNMQRHRHREFIRFLNVVEKQVPVGKIIHAIVDNYAARQHPNVRRWLERHPRWTFHFTPTSASWLNAVEGFFMTLTKRRSSGVASFAPSPT